MWDLFRAETPGHELYRGLALGIGLIAGVVLLRFLWDLAVYGPRAMLRNGLRIDPETWRLIGILIFIAIVGMTVWFQYV